jgi:hypothetical protein
MMLRMIFNSSKASLYTELLLSAKLKKRTKHLSEMPIKRHFGFVFEKVSPPTQN